MEEDRLRYLVYRCNACKRFLTKYDILDKWLAYEASGEQMTGLCTCGGSRISPTNLSVWEELTSPRVWRLWWKAVFLPWWRRRRS